MDEDIYNKIADLSLKCFNSLPKTGKPKGNEWTVFSCIVQEYNSNFEVVALGSGSKCIGISKMCPKGTILNDSHAEVICRRSFLRYLYDQMSVETSIMVFNKETSKFVLKNVKYHFFTTHVPCGDAAIFPKQEAEDFGDILTASDDPIEVPKKKCKIDEDIFRTGAKCLKEDSIQDLKAEGSGYHVLGAVRTKPGRGDPTSSLSCSDKLLKWCHLGIQGALLSMLLDKPIYLSSITIAGQTPFCLKAIERALYGRLRQLKLMGCYRGDKKMVIRQVETRFFFGKSEEKQPSASSIAWVKCSNKRSLEVAVNGRKQGITKKHLTSENGRLKICKLELLKQFVNTVNMFNIKLNKDVGIAKLGYGEIKKLAIEYQKNFDIVKKCFKVWSSKDPTMLNFNSI